MRGCIQGGASRGGCIHLSCIGGGYASYWNICLFSKMCQFHCKMNIRFISHIFFKYHTILDIDG